MIKACKETIQQNPRRKGISMMSISINALLALGVTQQG